MHVDDEESKRHQCPICLKRFRFQSNSNRHSKKHSTELYKVKNPILFDFPGHTVANRALYSQTPELVSVSASYTRYRVIAYHLAIQ